MVETTLNSTMSVDKSLRKMLSNLLPLWLFSILITAEGFPAPPISIEVAHVCFAAACLLLVSLIIKKWISLEILLLSLYPFILGCAFLLSLGIGNYHIINKSRLIQWSMLQL